MELLGTGTQRSGKASRITIGADILTFTNWKVDQQVNDLETTNFTSYDETTDASYGEGITGIDVCNITFGGAWDASANPYDDPPGLYPRDDLADVAFYTNIVDNVSWVFDYIRLRSTSNGAEVSGLVTFTCSGMSQGIYTQPTGSA